MTNLDAPANTTTDARKAQVTDMLAAQGVADYYNITSTVCSDGRVRVDVHVSSRYTHHLHPVIRKAFWDMPGADQVGVNGNVMGLYFTR